MRRTVAWSSVGALVVVVIFSVFLATRRPISAATNAPSPLLGRMAPALNATELAGGHFSLGAQRGKVVVVNFWASWCAPCRTEAPELSTFAWQHRNQGVVVVGVVFNDTLNSARAFARLYGSLYPSVADPGGLIANSYGVTAPPTSYVIDRHGRVAAMLLGATNAKQLAAVVARVST